MSSNYKGSVVLLIVCVISTHLCPINSNVIPNDNRSPIERQTVGKVFVGESDLPVVNPNDKIDKRYDNKGINTQKIIQQLKKQSTKPADLELYGYASMIDPRAQSPHNRRQNNNDFQYNSYQQLLNSMKMGDGVNPFQFQQIPIQPNPEEETIHVMKDYLKKYDIKRYFLKKILGDAYEREEGHDEGFFDMKHLRRHGTAGMAAKVFGELIGIKIRKTIDSFGDTVSDYAKELTTNGFVSIGNSFSKLFRGS